MFFDGWDDIWRILIVGTLSYVATVAFLRVSGKRTLSKFNAFDFVVTIAFGSILATVILNKDIALAEGITAIGLLIGLQFIVTSLSVRSDAFASIIKGEPTLLYSNGRFLNDAMRRARVPEAEIRAAIRERGLIEEQIAAVILETEGTFSVLSKEKFPGTVSETLQAIENDSELKF